MGEQADRPDLIFCEYQTKVSGGNQQELLFTAWFTESVYKVQSITAHQKNTASSLSGRREALRRNVIWNDLGCHYLTDRPGTAEEPMFYMDLTQRRSKETIYYIIQLGYHQDQIRLDIPGRYGYKQ